MMWGTPLHPTPVPSATAPEPARERLANGLYVWDPARDSCGYWAQPFPYSPEHVRYVREQLAAPYRKDRE